MRIALLVALLAACARTPDLEPAPEAARISGPGESATAMDAGVRVVASSQAWRGTPERLTALTPILVTLENHSAHPLLVHYDLFALRADSGQTFAVVPPMQIRGTERTPVTYARYPYHRFAVSPWHATWYPYLDPWDGPWGFAPTVTDVDWVPVELPTADMIHRALPEGVLQPGGRVAGFVYLQPVTAPGRLQFQVSLVDARTGEPFGEVDIPFVFGDVEPALARDSAPDAAGIATR